MIQYFALMGDSYIEFTTGSGNSKLGRSVV